MVLTKAIYSLSLAMYLLIFSQDKLCNALSDRQLKVFFPIVEVIHSTFRGLLAEHQTCEA